MRAVRAQPDRGPLLTAPPLVLVGLMGSGKTTVGRLVAERTGRRLVDTDDAIHALTGRSVRELWEQGGEAAYRRLESRVVLDGLAADEQPVVIAAPGGAVLDPEVRDALGAPSVLVVWLRGAPEVLAGRVHTGDHRPLLGDHPEEVLRKMAAERTSIYAGVADSIIDTDRMEPEAIAADVIALMTPGGPG